MKKSKTIMGALVLMIVATIIIACSKQNATRQETTIIRDEAASGDLTLAEMIEALRWEEGREFFENQPIKDYTAACEMVLNDCDFVEKGAGLPYYISWELRMPNGSCNPNFGGSCIVIRHKENSFIPSNIMGYFEDGKFVIVPTTEENGFTADGYLAIGAPVEVQADSIVIQEGIYTAYYDEETGRYTAVAVDYHR